MAYWMLYPSPRNRDRGEGEVSLYIFHIMDGSQMSLVEIIMVI